MFKTIVSAFIFLFMTQQSYSDTGPCKDDINTFLSACRCAESPAPHQYNILCVGQTVEEMDSFDRIPGHFRLLHIQNTSFTKIIFDAFKFQTFDQIFIEDNEQLKEIDKTAFNVTQPAKHLIIRNNPVLLSSDIFNLTAALRPTFQIELQGNGMTRIPESFGNNMLVEHLYLHDNNIRTIDSNDTFSGLTNLKQLTLYNNQMKTIDGLELNSTNDLSVFLNNNNLNEFSFKSGPVSNTNKKVKLFLQDNLFESLDSKIFEPFVMNPQNELYFHNNEFKCDALRMNWVKQYDNIFNVWCVNRDASVFDIELY